jgi:hypothetical protein
MRVTKRDIIVFIAGVITTLLLTAIFHPDSTETKAKRTIKDAQRKVEKIFK